MTYPPILCPESRNPCLTIIVDSKGASGGISISWNPLLVTLNDASSSFHSLSSSFHILGFSIKGFLMNVYGTQMVDSKMNLLNHIDWFHNTHIDSPLIIGGDFNMISNPEEKKGGIKALLVKDMAFKDTISCCDLVDIQTSSGFFT